jgi:hypothetical protein
MAIVGILLVGVLITVYEAPSLYREKRFRDLLVFMILTILGLLLSILLLLKIPVINPTKLIEAATSLFLGMFKIGFFLARGEIF